MNFDKQDYASVTTESLPTKNTKKIKFENKVDINHTLTLIMTKTAYNSIGGAEKVRELLQYVSSQRSLLISIKKDESNNTVNVYIFLPQGMLVCKEEKNDIKIIVFKKPTLTQMNIGLSRGTVFYFESINVKIIIPDIMKKLFSNGVERDCYNSDSMDMSSQNAVSDIIDYFDKNSAIEGNCESNSEEKSNGEELLKMLGTAEHYSVLSYELETKKIIENGKTSYVSIESVEYNRKDRQA
ncbi:MAG: hypothetical protein IKJ47_05365, partial [Oscillospiraceae bacterium]|nr:hypothetical protein [Oscillospiraceae bacterium]